MTIIYGILGLGILIFVHELGHFIVAKIFKVRVKSFSIGMGPVLLHKKIGQTDYRLSLIPLGGYCGMKGEKSFQRALSEKLPQIPKTPHSLYGVHPLKRALIGFAGPFFNLLFAIIAYSIMSMVPSTEYSTGNKIILSTEVYENVQSVAAENGLQTGDKIIAIDNTPIHYFNDISEKIYLSADKKLKLTLDRNGKIFEKTLIPARDKKTGLGKIGVFSWIDPVITNIQPDSPAQQAGLQKGDVITNAEGFPVLNTIDLEKIMQNRSTLSITYKRNTELFTSTITLNDTTKNFFEGVTWQIFAIQKTPLPFFKAIKQGSIITIENTVLTIKSLGLLFKGGQKSVSGPIGISLMLGETIKTGFSSGFFQGLVNILHFLAIISISLCIMNLLPIPILDGGLILAALIEAVVGKGIKPSILLKAQFVGLTVIILLFALGLFNDVSNIVTHFQH